MADAAGSDRGRHGWAAPFNVMLPPQFDPGTWVVLPDRDRLAAGFPEAQRWLRTFFGRLNDLLAGPAWLRVALGRGGRHPLLPLDRHPRDG